MESTYNCEERAMLSSSHCIQKRNWSDACLRQELRELTIEKDNKLIELKGIMKLMQDKAMRNQTSHDLETECFKFLVNLRIPATQARSFLQLTYSSSSPFSSSVG